MLLSTLYTHAVEELAHSEAQRSAQASELLSVKALLAQATHALEQQEATTTLPAAPAIPATDAATTTAAAAPAQAAAAPSDAGGWLRTVGLRRWFFCIGS